MHKHTHILEETGIQKDLGVDRTMQLLIIRMGFNTFNPCGEKKEKKKMCDNMKSTSVTEKRNLCSCSV